jgi:ankyrin repeat domain-containing protein 50
VVPPNNIRCINHLYLTNPLDDLADLRRKLGDRAEGTCEWLLAHQDFTAWLNGDNPQLLRLVGDPGIGKSMMSSFLVEELEKKCTKMDGVLFVYYFCDNKDERRRTPSAVLRGLLLQLLRQSPDLFKYVEADYRDMPQGLHNFDPLWRIFVSILKDAQLRSIWILVDALDECEKEARIALLETLSKLFRPGLESQDIKAKFVITCRPEPDINAAFKIQKSLRIDSAKVNKDLQRFVNLEVDKIGEAKDWPSDLIREVKKVLKTQARGTFLWVSLILKDLSDPSTLKYQVKEKLKVLPESLEVLYDGILSKIPPQNIKDAILLLQCIVVARRPLTIADLATIHAMAGEDWPESSAALTQKLEEMDDSYKSCGTLLFVDPEENTVNLVHQSAKDYLLGQHLKQHTQLHQYHVAEHGANYLMFQSCWRLLSLADFDKFSTRMTSNRETTNQWVRETDSFHFLVYAASEWDEHALASSSALISALTSSSSWHKSYLSKRTSLRDAWLRRASARGQVEVVKLLLEKGAELESKDSNGRTPLSWAAEKGHEAVVKLLLEKGAELESKGSNDWTPLSWAAENGQEAVVKLLLEKGAELESKDRWFGRTPLSLAAEKGHEAVVKLLLEKGAELESKGSRSGQTPLSLAAENGHEAVVKLLLEKGAELESKGRNGRTPLSWAAGKGHEAVVKLLLEKGAELESKGSNSPTPLSWAAGKGHEAVVKLLLEKGAEPESKGNNGRTPLSWAAEKGHEAVVKLLLEKGAKLESKGSRSG